MRDATKQISKGPSSWDLSPNCLFPTSSFSFFSAASSSWSRSWRWAKREKLCQRKIAAQFIAKVHYSANVASLSSCGELPLRRAGRGEGERGVTRAAAPYLKSPLSCAIFAGTCLIIKCEKCLHTFRLTLMKRRWCSTPPPALPPCPFPTQLPISSLTAMNFFYLPRRSGKVRSLSAN